MLRLLLFAASSLHVAFSCIPMRNDEESPCIREIEIQANPNHPTIKYVMAIKSADGNMFTCPEGTGLIEQDGATINGPFPGAAVFCDGTTGQWKVSKPPATSDENLLIACGYKECPAGTKDASVCTNVPMNPTCLNDEIKEEMMGQPNHKFTCPPGYSLAWDMGNGINAIVDGNTVTCTALGEWMPGTGTSTASPIKVSCGLFAQCGVCKIDTSYDPQYNFGGMPAKSTQEMQGLFGMDVLTRCLTPCPAGSVMFNTGNDMAIVSTITCNFQTMMIVDPNNAPVTNWACVEGQCPDIAYSELSCVSGKVCTKEIMQEDPNAKIIAHACPAGQTINYTPPGGTPMETGQQTINCGTMNGQFAWLPGTIPGGSKFSCAATASTTAPTDGCPALLNSNCGGCDFTKVQYSMDIISKNVATCADGLLVPMGGTASTDPITCDPAVGMWKDVNMNTVTSASCTTVVTDMPPLNDCLASANPNWQNVKIKGTCSNGKCSLMCNPAGPATYTGDISGAEGVPTGFVFPCMDGQATDTQEPANFILGDLMCT